MLSITEENYLKALLRIATDKEGKGEAGTNQLASMLNVRPATVTDMLKKLKEKNLVEYVKYGKITLTKKGFGLATEILRKHRLWETFLFDKLGFSWDEVHDVAEQLEHVRSEKLVERLDKFLDFPQFDPHGDVIPKANGEFKMEIRNSLASSIPGETYTVIAVKDNSPSFLQHISRLGIVINGSVHVIDRFDFDDSLSLEIDNKTVTVSGKIAENVYIK